MFNSPRKPSQSWKFVFQPIVKLRNSKIAAMKTNLGLRPYKIIYIYIYIYNEILIYGVYAERLRNDFITSWGNGLRWEILGKMCFCKEEMNSNRRDKSYNVFISGYLHNVTSRCRRVFPPVQTGSGAHPTSCKMGTGSFPGVNFGRGVLLTTHPVTSVMED